MLLLVFVCVCMCIGKWIGWYLEYIFKNCSKSTVKKKIPTDSSKTRGQRAYKVSNIMLVKEMKWKTEMSNHYTPRDWLKQNVTPWNARKWDKLYHSSVADRNVKQCSLSGRQFDSFLTSLKVPLPCDPAMAFRVICPGVTKYVFIKRVPWGF